MASKSKLKGTYHEKWFVKWLADQGIEAKRQPLSGSLGGEFTGDLKLKLKGKDLIAEIKYRTTNRFPSPFTVLENRDLAFYKRRTGSPQIVVVMSGDMFTTLMENNDGNPKPKSSSLP